MLLFTALFGGLMLLSIESRRRMVADLLIGCIAILGISPPPAQAQFCLPCVIQAVLATISQTIGNWLSVINGVVSDIRKLYEQTIWPISAINLGRVGERATRRCDPLSPRRTGQADFPTSGSPENSRLGHAQAVARSRAYKYTKPRLLKWSL
jgi:hypothetical protein